MTEAAQKPNIEEQYSSATKTADLRVDTRDGCRNVADLIIANGMSPGRLGALLLRLHSEWDGAEKPRRPTPEAITALANTLPRLSPTGARKGALRLDLVAANQQAGAWYTHELRLLVGKLKSLPAARLAVAAKAVEWGVPEPTEFAGGVLQYWLDQTCHVCDGRKRRAIPGTPMLSDRPCMACGGSGVAQPKGGEVARKMLNHLDECVGHARRDIKRRLRPPEVGA